MQLQAQFLPAIQSLIGNQSGIFAAFIAKPGTNHLASFRVPRRSRAVLA
jgi:hypothetical protein